MQRLALALILLLPISAAHANITGKPRVIDGDTIHIGDTKIRLHCINVPETKQECYRVECRPYRCGEAATDALRVLIGADPAHLTQTLHPRPSRVQSRLGTQFRCLSALPTFMGCGRAE